MANLKITGKKGLTEVGGVSSSFILSGAIVLGLKKIGVEIDMDTAIVLTGLLTTVSASLIRMISNYKKHTIKKVVKSADQKVSA
jgi:hypothetical protein